MKKKAKWITYIPFFPISACFCYQTSQVGILVNEFCEAIAMFVILLCTLVNGLFLQFDLKIWFILGKMCIIYIL